MKFISFSYNKHSNLLLQFPGFTKPYTQKRLAVYHLEAVLIPIKDSNTEANSYTCLVPSKEYLEMTDENYISFTTLNVYILDMNTSVTLLFG